ncbi:cupin domain-containing protein [Thauera sinica]|uniref:Hydroxyquinol 1,2-dioxygenase n=1 Tax=Thauera sinica TaxID=2665146 RepID=A0ABW1AN82_9RHOO|nr:hydroxyquinol 1,2-dioxygenase [Thauera sp. K11]ATE61659.1 hydroxyquinol 1,2-dioxygenase [Thauera sp. K11]
MSEFVTRFGAFDSFEKGHIEIIDDDPRNYVFSNVFEVASRAKPYEKIAVAKNLEYVIEAIRAEGTSGWMAASHDEFCIVMDGEVSVEFVKLDGPDAIAPAGKDGTVAVGGAPKGKRMGSIRLRRGHQALLPKGAAYRFSSANPSVMIQQTIVGDLTVQKWAEICYR